VSTVGLDEKGIGEYIRHEEKFQTKEKQIIFNFDYRPLLGAFRIPTALPVVSDSF
jgi:hypothetical protein